MHAFGGSDIESRRDLRLDEFLKYVGCVCMIG